MISLVIRAQFAVSLILIVIGLLVVSGLVIAFSDFVDSEIKDVFDKAKAGDKDFASTVATVQSRVL